MKSHFPQMIKPQKYYSLFLFAWWIFCMGPMASSLFSHSFQIIPIVYSLLSMVGFGFFSTGHSDVCKWKVQRFCAQSMTIQEGVAQSYFEFATSNIRLDEVICDLSKCTWHQIQPALKADSWKALILDPAMV